MSRLRIRTLTFGVAPSGTEDFRVFDQAIATVKSIGEHFAGQGYEVRVRYEPDVRSNDLRQLRKKVAEFRRRS